MASTWQFDQVIRKARRVTREQRLGVHGHNQADMDAAVLESMLTCPHCGFAAQETMPTDACLYFYECTNCKTLLRPKAGDCCVFCSFGSVKCPPVQEQRGCCA